MTVNPHAGRRPHHVAQAIDQDGYAHGTIAPAPGMAAAVPPLDAGPGSSRST
ncbi:hypothetical protein [Sphingobium herbicidovorans]